MDYLLKSKENFILLRFFLILVNFNHILKFETLGCDNMIRVL
jgi:hypothetical protein